jgi:hypothetical protein
MKGCPQSMVRKRGPVFSKRSCSAKHLERAVDDPEKACPSDVFQATHRAFLQDGVDGWLLGVRLVFRARPLESRQRQAGGLDGDDFRERVERYLQAAGVVDLRHQQDIGDR